MAMAEAVLAMFSTASFCAYGGYSGLLTRIIGCDPGAG